MAAGLAEIELLIGNAIKLPIGDPFLIGLFVLLFFTVLIVFLGMNLTVGLMIMIPLLVMLVVYQGIPEWFLFVVVFGVGILFFLAVTKIMRR